MSNFDNPYAPPAAPAPTTTDEEGPLAAARRAERRGGLDASKGMRFANFLIDSTVLAVLQLALSAHDPLLDWFIAVAVSLAYYTFTEGYFGRTPAKFLTKTRVISIDGGPPTFGAVFKRSLFRMIPFEPISFLAGEGWHDRASKTRVVRAI